MGTAPKILIVEDERMIAEYFKVYVESLGYNVCGIAMTAEAAVRMAQEEEPDLVFMDVRLMGQADGVDAANAIHRKRPIPTVYVTGSTEPETIAKIQSDHPSAVLIKPVLAEQLKEALTRFCPLP